jgi:hypothetical protein
MSPGEVHGVGLFEAQQVGRRDEPDGLVVGVEDRQVVDVPADHLQEHLEGEGVGGAGDGVGGHDVGDGGGGVDVDGEHAGAQVTVGEDAGQAAVAGHEQGGHPLGRHQARGVPDADSGIDADRVTRDEVTHGGLEDGPAGARQLHRGDRAAHPARPLGVEEGVEVGVVGAQAVEVVGGQDEGEGVLAGGDVEGRRVALGEGDRAEAGALAAPVDQGALRVVHVGGARAHDIEVVVVAALLDEAGAAAEVLHGHPGREAVEDALREGIEGFVAREEVTRLGQLDVEGHAVIVSAHLGCRAPSGSALRPTRGGTRRAACDTSVRSPPPSSPQTPRRALPDPRPPRRLDFDIAGSAMSKL